jgi:hypothetical protein
VAMPNDGSLAISRAAIASNSRRLSSVATSLASRRTCVPSPGPRIRADCPGQSRTATGGAKSAANPRLGNSEPLTKPASASAGHAAQAFPQRRLFDSFRRRSRDAP